MEITREITLDAPADDVWHALTDDDSRAEWLERDSARPTRVELADPGRALRWTWWDDDGSASTVTLTLVPLADGGTHVHVVERLVAPPSRTSPQARASAGAAWDHRLVGLELLLLDLAVLV